MCIILLDLLIVILLENFGLFFRGKFVSFLVLKYLVWI